MVQLVITELFRTKLAHKSKESKLCYYHDWEELFPEGQIQNSKFATTFEVDPCTNYYLTPGSMYKMSPGGNIKC